jgi:hypothetical protein
MTPLAPEAISLRPEQRKPPVGRAHRASPHASVVIAGRCRALATRADRSVVVDVLAALLRDTSC